MDVVLLLERVFGVGEEGLGSLDVLVLVQLVDVEVDDI